MAVSIPEERKKMIGFTVPEDSNPQKPAVPEVIFPRFRKEIVPFEVAIAKPWIANCEPDLLPRVQKDHVSISRLLFDGKVPATSREKKLYVATAGSPCSGKSSELDRELANPETDYRYGNIVMVDPDRYAMEYMNYTYRPMLSAGEKARLGAEEAGKVAYNRSRPGSNIVSNLVYNQAFDGGYHIAHGTTMTSPFIGGMLQKLGEEGYYRRLLLCYAPDDVRVEAGNKRINKEAHYQVDPSDFINKGLMFPQRMGDYFTHGDHLKLLWKPELEKNAVLAAEYIDGKKIIRNQAAYDAFTVQYQKAATTNPDPNSVSIACDWQAPETQYLPRWEEIEQKYFNRNWAPKAANTNPKPPQDEHRFGFRM